MRTQTTSEWDRRGFARVFALGCAAVVCRAHEPAQRLPVLLAADAPADEGRGIVRLRLADFPLLARGLASVRVGTATLAGTFNRSIFPVLLVQRDVDGRFHALNAECPHEGCIVRPFDPATERCSCPCHGSQFALDGRRLAGPANASLLSYPIAFDPPDALRIEIPDWAFDVRISRPLETENLAGRVRLEFRSNTQIEYEILFRSRADEAWRPATFARAPAAPLDQQVFAGEDDLSWVYVDATGASGFYAVALRLRQV